MAQETISTVPVTQLQFSGPQWLLTEVNEVFHQKKAIC